LFLAERIEVSREEYYRELSSLGVKTRRRLELRSEYYRTLAYIRWMPWRREELLTRAREIREAIALLDEDIAYERELIARKVIRPPPPPPIYIGTEEKTGYDIYYNPTTKAYVIIHPTTKERIREEHKIVIEYTASIVTGEPRPGAREFIDVEITAITAVKEMDSSEMAKVEKDMDSAVMTHLVETGWGYTLPAFTKTGIAYNGLSIIEEQRHYGYPVPQHPRMAIHVEKTERSVRPRDYGWAEVMI